MKSWSSRLYRFVNQGMVRTYSGNGSQIYRKALIKDLYSVSGLEEAHGVGSQPHNTHGSQFAFGKLPLNHITEPRATPRSFASLASLAKDMLDVDICHNNFISQEFEIVQLNINEMEAHGFQKIYNGARYPYRHSPLYASFSSSFLLTVHSVHLVVRWYLTLILARQIVDSTLLFVCYIYLNSINILPVRILFQHQSRDVSDLWSIIMSSNISIEVEQSSTA